MKIRQLSWCSTVVLLSAVCMAESRSPLPIRDESKQELKSLADDTDPYLAIALLPEQQAGTVVPLSSVPQEVVVRATDWIKKIVKPEWLPVDFDKSFHAVKDAKLWEKRDKNGYVFSKIEGDFITLEYEMQGCGFHIQESGDAICVRIDLSEAEGMKGDLRAVIHRRLIEFFKVPLQVFPTETHALKSLTGGALLSRKDRSALPDAVDMLSVANWWDNYSAYTDGRILVVVFPELESGANKTKARIGLPSRF